MIRGGGYDRPADELKAPSDHRAPAEKAWRRRPSALNTGIKMSAYFFETSEDDSFLEVAKLIGELLDAGEVDTEEVVSCDILVVS